MRSHSLKLLSILSGLGSFCLTSAVLAAVPVDLRSQSVGVMHSFFAGNTNVKEISRQSDFNHTNHVRIQETYAGYPIHGGEAVMHIPQGQNAGLALQSLFTQSSKTTMNGIFYQGLDADLSRAPAYIFSKQQAKHALKTAIMLHHRTVGVPCTVSDEKVELMVFVDQKNKAHWAFKAIFLAAPAGSTPMKPVYLLDASTFTVYQKWDDIQSAEMSTAGGFGGNEKMGKLTYDALAGDPPVLQIQRDNLRKVCYLANAEVTVRDARTGSIVQFDCETKNHSHNDIYWDAYIDSVNGAFSPANDALYVGKVIKDMYNQWYQRPVLVNSHGHPMMLNMIVHEKMENAYWDGAHMVFGDGENYFYPMVSLGVASHEIAHGFTGQNARLEYRGQSGGLNESFSDMAAQAAEYYATGHNNWHIGWEITKAKGTALRYMDEPTRDCGRGVPPGEDCSIGHVKDYHYGLDVHYSSGIFNKIFYLLSTSSGWTTKKAFNVMVQANSHYWTPTDNFNAAACGVISAAKDYGYDPDPVLAALSQVGLTPKC